MQPKFCSNCGAALAAGQRFCARCGAPVSPPTPLAREATPPGPTRRGPWALVGAAIAIIGIALVAILLAVAPPGDGPPTPVEGTASVPSSPASSGPALTPGATRVTLLPSATPHPATATRPPATATPRPTDTPTLSPLNKQDSSSVLQWVQYALRENAIEVFDALTSEANGVFYSDFIEGGQPKTKQQFLTDLRQRLASHPNCDGYIDYSNPYDAYAYNALHIWTSGWSPVWEMTQMCYGEPLDCHALTPPHRSTVVAFIFKRAEDGWGLTHVWLGDYEKWNDLDPYKAPISSCDQLAFPEIYAPAPGSTATVQSCPGALPTRLHIGGFAYVSYDPPLSNLVRSGTGRREPVIGRIEPGKAVEVLQGPQCADNWTWWEVRALETGLVGWTVEGDSQSYWLIPCASRNKCGDSQAPTDFGPAAIWKPAPEDFTKFQSCRLQSPSPMDCVVSVMQASGASPQAIEFTRFLKGEAFMASFEELSTVDLATIVYPVRANDNFQYVLINGTPRIVHAEDAWEIDIKQDANYPALVRKYPNLLLWGGDNRFERTEQLPNGGQRFVFRYSLVNGCHACGTDSYALVAFDFDSVGRFLGMRLLALGE